MGRGGLSEGGRGARDGEDRGAALAAPGFLGRAGARAVARAGMLACLGAVACSADARLADLEPRAAASTPVRAPHAIDFATASTGLADVAGHPIGFSLLLPSARAATYLPARVRVDTESRELVLAPPPGAPGTSAVGVAVLLPSARARVETTLVQPPVGAGAGERAGLWFGANDDNYIELGLVSSPEGPLLRAQLEEDGMSGAPITRRVQLPTDGVRLALELEPTERVVRAYAAVGGTGAEQLLASFEAIPDAWFERDRAGLADGDASPRGLVGVLASAGSRPTELPSLGQRFRGFEISTTGLATDLTSSAGRWQRGAASTLPAGLTIAAAAALGGKVYALGGASGAAAERALFVYDPEVDAWQAGPRLPESFPPVTRPALVARGGELVVIGGQLAAGGATTKVIAFEPVAGTWSSLARLPVALGAATAQAIGGDIYVAGGLDGAASHAELWVLRAGTSAWSPAAPMSSARHGAASTVIGGRLFVFGGMRDGAALALAEVYDPSTNEWAALAPLPAPVSFPSATAARSLAVVLAGDAGSSPAAPAWLYDPGTDTWSALPPAPRPRTGAAATHLGDVVFVLGGAALDGAVDELHFE